MSLAYTFGPFRLDPRRHELARDGRPLPLPPKAFDLLLRLVEQRERVVTRRELLDALWPERAVSEGSLTQTVFGLRKALGDDGDDFIATVPRIGYRFVAAVTPLDAGPATPPAPPAPEPPTPTDTAGVFRFGPFRLDVQARRLWRGDELVALTPKAFDALVVLVENRRRALSRDELDTALWPDHTVDEANLSQTIFALRRALGDNDEPRRYVATVSRFGYRFVAEVEPVDGDAPRSAARAPRHAGPGVVAAATLALLLVALGDRGPQAEPPSLLVLPFADASGAGAGEYVTDGLTESLIDAAARMPGLRVIARTTAFRYKGQARDARRIALDLGVDYALTGEVRRGRERPELRCDLLHVASGTQLWGQRFELRDGDLRSVQGAIAHGVTARLSPGLRAATPAPARSRASADGEAYRLYLEARYFWNKRTDAGLRRSVVLFHAALARDPRDAQLHAGLAAAYAVLPEYSTVSEAEAYPAAREAARAALALDDTLGEAHAVLARIIHHSVCCGARYRACAGRPRSSHPQRTVKYVSGARRCGCPSRLRSPAPRDDA